MTSITTWKFCACSAFLSLALLLPVQPALAQASESATPAPTDSATPAATAPPALRRHASGRYQRPTLDDRIAVLSKNLSLTEPQRSALKAILEQRQQDTMRIRESAAPGNVRIEQFRALQERTVVKIRAILTDEQKKKYDPLLPRTRPAPSTSQRSVEDWIKATTPK